MARKKWKKKERGAKKESAVVEKEAAEKGGNRALLILGVVLILAGGYYLMGRSAGPSDTGPSTTTLKGKFILFSELPNTHEKGKVKIVEYFDFYCPHCYRFHTERWPALKQKYGDRVELVDYGFPLRDSSIPPIEAYEIARDLGKGEEMKDAMFRAIHEEGGADISNTETLADIAESVGIDREVFTKALTSRSALPEINKHVRTALNDYKVDSTPTLIIDGNIKVTDSSVENLEKIIDSILEGE
ncbi:MAG: hypothetical protein D6733_02925 [Methanobacteriota archaeon]|nr:MAG: hypothetical protein D6733_02925 [Euryarchaeota archaeon]